MNYTELELFKQWQNKDPSMKQDLKILYDLIIKYKPSIVLEIGTGYSTLAMLRASNDLVNIKHVQIISTDIDAKRVELFKQKIDEYGLWYSTLYNKDSIEFLSQYEGLADFIFIDSSHEYELTLKELIEASGKLYPDGIIIMHDVIAIQDVHRAINTFLEIHEFKYFVLNTQCGLGVLMRK